MRILSGGSLKQSVETITFKEGESLTSAKLEEISKILKRVKEERSYLLLDATTAHELRLHFHEVIKELGSLAKNEAPSEELSKRYQLLKEIRNSLDNALIDEVDLVLDCLKELNFSSGLWVSMAGEIKTTMEKIFIEISKDDELNKVFNLEKETEALFDKKKLRRKDQTALSRNDAENQRL
jgi:hypothetical protein